MLMNEFQILSSKLSGFYIQNQMGDVSIADAKNANFWHLKTFHPPSSRTINITYVQK